VTVNNVNPLAAGTLTESSTTREAIAKASTADFHNFLQTLRTLHASSLGSAYAASHGLRDSIPLD
jgi:hypothetical protein